MTDKRRGIFWHSGEASMIGRRLRFLGAAALTLALCACGGQEAAPPTAPTTAVAAFSDPTLQKTFDSSCKICHGVAGSGAPLTGDAAAWQPRVAQGLDTLLDHTISGYKAMPPMGLCAHCSEDDFVVFIEHMSATRFE